MTRTGYDTENGEVIFPDKATSLEVIATVKHLNGSYLAAAKMYLQSSEVQNELIEKAIMLIAKSMKIEQSAVDYLSK